MEAIWVCFVAGVIVKTKYECLKRNKMPFFLRQRIFRGKSEASAANHVGFSRASLLFQTLDE